MYSQNNEEQVILNYFSNQSQGIFLDIGANDGITLSNVRALAEKGWKGALIEPSMISYEKAVKNYEKFKKVRIYNCAISDKTGHFDFYESGEHLGHGDHSLLSSLKQDETKRWTREEFTKTSVNSFTYTDWRSLTKFKFFDFISIDAEGYDYEILTQINLKFSRTKMICIEHNGKEIEKYRTYCERYKMRQVLLNNENIIMAI